MVTSKRENNYIKRKCLCREKIEVKFNMQHETHWSPLYSHLCNNLTSSLIKHTSSVSLICQQYYCISKTVGDKYLVFYC